MEKYVNFRGKIIVIRKFTDGLWRDPSGTIWALTEDKASVDPRTRCGVGMFSLPFGDCGVHDYLYSSPYYQLIHTRKEADEYLLRTNPGLLGKFFYYMSRIFGGKYWEQDKTR